MKVKLTKNISLDGEQFFAGSVIDILQPQAETIVAAGDGVFVPDGTMARKIAYGNIGCFPNNPNTEENQGWVGEMGQNKKQTQKK